MKTPTRITKTELRCLAKGIYQIRNAKCPAFSLKKPVFEIANKYIDVLEAIINMSREEPVICKRVGKNYQFNPSVCGYFETDEEAKRNRVMIYTEIRLKKKVNGLRIVGTGLFFSNKHPESYKVETYAQGDGNTFEKDVEYGPKDLVLDRYAKHVISYWKRWLKKKNG
jgi:hypothetical protein